MGRHTSIYMLNKQNAFINLYLDLKYFPLYKNTFREYVRQNNQNFDINSEELFNNILKVVKNDINTITPSYLWEVVEYLKEELEYGKYDNRGLSWQSDFELCSQNQRLVRDSFERYGINLLYEVHTSTVCSSYMFQYGSYTHYFPIDGDFSEGYNISSIDFLGFNDYVILIMYKIIQSDLYEEEIDNQNLNMIEIKSVIQKYQNNQVMVKCIEKEFEWLKSRMKNKEDEERFKIERNTVYYAELFLIKSLEMKSRINPQISPRILILDSF